MTIRHLNVFIKVCELGSVSKAAEELHVAQPSVSQTIKELENYYEVILFTRVSKKLILTEEGKTLLAKAKEVVNEFNEFETLASKADLNPVIRIGATMTFGAMIIPNFSKKLKAAFPNAKIEFCIDKPATLEEKILKGDLDFALEEGIINSLLIHAEEIGTDELIAVCAKNSSIPEKMKLEDILKYDLLLREVGNPSRHLIDMNLMFRGLQLEKPKMESVCNSVIIAMAINDEGIGFVPASTAANPLEHNLIRKIELDTQLKRKLYVISHKNKVFNKTCLKAYNMALKLFNN